MKQRAKFEHTGLLAINPAAFGLEFLIGSPLDRKNRAIGDAAIVDIRGPLEHHAGGFFDNYDEIKGRVREALASNAKSVVLAFDSPGGLVSGVYEASGDIRAMAAAARKPLYAYANGECCSAAYALACACEKIVVPPGANVGSIGVVALAVDATAADKAMGLRFEAISSGVRKLDGNPHVAMTPESVSALQRTVDEQARVFFDLVASARSMSPDAVRGFQAGIFVGRQATEVGLADEVATLEGFLNNSASQATEITAMNYKEIRKALGEKSAGDDEEAKKCRAALAAMDADADGGDPESDEDKKKKEEEAAKAKTPAAATTAEADKPKDDEKKKDDEKAAAIAAANPLVALASEVQSLTAWKANKEAAEKRATLLATRPDFTPATLKALEGVPVETLEWSVKHLARGPVSQVAAALASAQPGVKATLGAGQGDESSVKRDGYTLGELDAQMGLALPTNAIKHNGTRMSLGVMTPDQARAVQAARKKEGAVT